MIFFNGYTLTIEEAHEEIRQLQEQIKLDEEEIRKTEQQYGKDSFLYEDTVRFLGGVIENNRQQMMIYQAFIRTTMLIQNFVSPPPSKNLSSQKVLKAIESFQNFLKQDFSILDSHRFY